MSKQKSALTYEQALPRRPKGACYCDLDDRACYEAGHWSAIPAHYVSINGHTIRKRGDNPIRIARSPSDQKPQYANEVEILDAAGKVVAKLVYDPEHRIMRCGARLVLEADNVRVVR